MRARRLRLGRSGWLTLAAGEIVIVVVGILVAFALDAAWEGRAAAARERRP